MSDFRYGKRMRQRSLLYWIDLLPDLSGSEGGLLLSHAGLLRYRNEVLRFDQFGGHSQLQASTAQRTQNLKLRTDSR